MPQKLIATIDHLFAVTMTVVPLLAWIILDYFGVIMGAFIFIVYWIPKIKEERVDAKYSGSWIAWIKGAGNFFKKKK
tara:strand:+ start:9379 stop:9609 length:231 start_codon:yes stop_codon:yes gene_type:complete